jgi:hypothetical protein
MLVNELYLAVLPIIHLTDRFGFTEQVLTLFPDRNFATLFTPQEVDGFIQTFRNRSSAYLTSGNVIGYDVEKQPTAGGLVIVKVIQRVA